MKCAYYNENEPFAAQWLRNLIAAGHIAPGDVDERSIVDVRADDLRGYTQCHFFAGIGVWSYALRRAGWSDDRPVWTGSCPCQPFSSAGKQEADADSRHLWPHWLRLIREHHPAVIFGEQVSAAIGVGWLDDVFVPLESIAYACGAIDFPACGVGAPHIRQRLYFVADAGRASGRTEQRHESRSELGRGAPAFDGAGPRQRSESCAMADAIIDRRASRSGDERCTESTRSEHRHDAERRGELGDSESGGRGECRDASHAGSGGHADGAVTDGVARAGVNGFWRDADWLRCIDGKARPVEPGTFPLAHGDPARVVRVCTSCLQKSSLNEKLCNLLEAAQWDEGRCASEVLQPIMRGDRTHEEADDASGRTLPGAALLSGEAMLEMSGDGATSQTPQGSRPDEQRSKQRGSVVPAMPCNGAPEADTLIDVLSLRQGVHSGIAPQPQQDLLCGVCGRMGANLRAATLVGNRTGRLRAYGNCIVAPQAEEFIKAYLEDRRDK